MDSKMFYEEVFDKILRNVYITFGTETAGLYNRLKYMTENNISTTHIDIDGGVCYAKEFSDVTRKLQSLFDTYESFIRNGGEKLVKSINGIPENSYQLIKYGDILAEYFKSFDTSLVKFIDCYIIDYSFAIYCDRIKLLKEFTPSINSDIQNLFKFLNF